MDRNNIIKVIREEFQTGKIRDDLFPMMTKFGVRDYSETVHSLSLNYITAIGRAIDEIAAVSEYPVYPYESNYNQSNMIAESPSSYYEEKKSKDAEIRPDSIWYSKNDNTPVLISEFERYEKNRIKNKKLEEKIQNLLIAYHQLGSKVPIILFVYWSYASVTPGDMCDVISILDKGFTLPNKKFISGIDSSRTSYLVYHCIASGDKEKLMLNQWIKIR